MRVGTLRELWRYPVKSMRGERLEVCRVEQRVGIPGDRSWALRDQRAGEIRGAKKIPQLLELAARVLEEPVGETVPRIELELPDGRVVTSDDPKVSDWISQAVGREVTLEARRPATDLDHYRRARRIDDVEAEFRASSAPPASCCRRRPCRSSTSSRQRCSSSYLRRGPTSTASSSTC